MTYTGTLMGIVLIVIAVGLFFVLEHDFGGLMIVVGMVLAGSWMFTSNLYSLQKSK